MLEAFDISPIKKFVSAEVFLAYELIIPSDDGIIETAGWDSSVLSLLFYKPL